MIIAVIAVYASIAVTMYANGSYAWSKGGTPADQYAMVALALAIDGCKCSFLRVAAICQQDGRRFAAVLVFILWWPCLAYSTFAGYSYLHTNRTVAGTDKQGQAEQRQRAQAAHTQAGADLRLALANPLWASTNACTTVPKGKAQVFCDAVATLRADQARAAAILTQVAPTDANPEVTGLAANTGIATERVQFLIALVPAVLVELLASVGFYAIGKRTREKAPGTLLGARLRSWLRGQGRAAKNAPAASLEASGAVLKAKPVAQAALPAGTPTVTWRLPP